MSTLFDQDMVSRQQPAGMAARDLDAFVGPRSHTRQLAAEVRLLETMLAERDRELSEVWQQLEDLMHENLLLIDETERRPVPVATYEDTDTMRVSVADVEKALAAARRARRARAVA